VSLTSFWLKTKTKLH